MNSGYGGCLDTRGRGEEKTALDFGYLMLILEDFVGSVSKNEYFGIRVVEPFLSLIENLRQAV